jgi:excisionase family DNA binding protein
MEKYDKIIEKLDNLEAVFIQQKTVLNLEEVATYTGLSKSCLYKKTSTGGIPCYKPNGKHIYFNKNEIDKWLLSNRKATSEEIESAATNYCLTGKRGGAK